jgi:hypothetical protein
VTWGSSRRCPCLATAVASQVPFYAATLARARLLKAQARLTECLRDLELRVDAWPAPRILLLLKLFATVFPASGAARISVLDDSRRQHLDGVWLRAVCLLSIAAHSPFVQPCSLCLRMPRSNPCCLVPPLCLCGVCRQAAPGAYAGGPPGLQLPVQLPCDQAPARGNRCCLLSHCYCNSLSAFFPSVSHNPLL